MTSTGHRVGLLVLHRVAHRSVGGCGVCPYDLLDTDFRCSTGPDRRATPSGGESKMETIVFLQPLNAELTEAVQSRLPEGFSLRVAERTDVAHLHACVADAKYVVTWDLGFDAALFAAAPHVR